MEGSSEKAAVSTLEAVYDHLQGLSANPSDDDLIRFGAFFTAECTTNLRSMREDPKHGRQAVIDDLKDLLNVWHLEKRQVDAQSTVVNADGSVTIFCQMSNRLSILGEILDPYPETVVVNFVLDDEQDNKLRISDFKSYGCRSGIVKIIQSKTAKGPYSDFEMQNGAL